MSDTARDVVGSTKRLKYYDPTFKHIDASYKQQIDTEVAKLTDYLLTHPDVVAAVSLDANRLTDETGTKLAQYVAASTTIHYLNLSKNKIGSATYLELAAALRVNTSLQVLYLYDNQVLDQAHINAAFIETLRLNPDRRAWSHWGLYSNTNELKRLNCVAKQMGPPSLLAQLDFAEECRAETKIHLI